MYQRKVDVDMLNAVKSVLADAVPLCSDEGLTLETSANTLFTAFSISTSTLHWYIVCHTITYTNWGTNNSSCSLKWVRLVYWQLHLIMYKFWWLCWFTKVHRVLPIILHVFILFFISNPLLKTSQASVCFLGFLINLVTQETIISLLTMKKRYCLYCQWHYWRQN